jgi:hypothetical protein
MRPLLKFAFVFTCYAARILADQTLSAREAGKHGGEQATVCGVVASARYSDRSKGQPNVSAIENTLSDRVDFAQLIKVYRASVAGEARYSPAEVVSTEVVPVIGDPNPSRICTSHVERQNLTMRMQIRRFTRLTNGFSRKFENHWAALALYFAYYNFCRIHSSIRVTPAMESKITNHVWDLGELLA